MAALAAKPATLSTSGTFSLNSGDSPGATRFLRVLSGYEREFQELTGYSPGDFPPIVVVLHDVTDDQPDVDTRASLRVDAVEGNTLRIQVDIPPGAADRPSTAAVLAQAMLLRQYYQGKSPVSGSRIAEFPPWLLHALGRLSKPEAKLAIVPSSYLKGKEPPSIADLLVQKAPDDSNTALTEIYETMAADLLSAGLKATRGDQALRDWVGTFDPSSPIRPPSSWPAGWSMQSVERRWLLLMAGQADEDSGGVALLDVGETLARYDGILMEVTTPDHSLALLKREKSSPYTVQQIASRLVALRLQANPIVTPLLDEAISLCAQFKRLPEKKIADQEKKLSSQRADIIRRSRAIESYLDWFEAAKIPVQSRLFDNLLHAPDSRVQKGPVGRYLDAVESRGW